MNARLGFSVTFQLYTDILLIDEVLGVGDVTFRKKSTDALRKRIKSDKIVIMVSHTPQTITNLCDRAVWIDGGVTHAEGNREEVLAQYLARARGVVVILSIPGRG